MKKLSLSFFLNGIWGKPWTVNHGNVLITNQDLLSFSQIFEMGGNRRLFNLADVLKHIHVTCAVIIHEGYVLAAQRSASMSLPLKWEFPGGKIDKGESPVECLKRELVEELGIQVHVGKSLPTTTHHYKTFLVTLYPFICSIESGDIVLHEHCAIAWLPPEKLHNLDWSEADVPVIDSFLAENKVAI